MQLPRAKRLLFILAPSANLSPLLLLSLSYARSEPAKSTKQSLELYCTFNSVFFNANYIITCEREEN